MFRVLELLGLLAPLAGAVLLLRYRRRSRPAVAWGMVACALGLLASGLGAIGLRASVLSAYRAGTGVEGVLEALGSWTALRLGLLALAGAVLVVAALVDRRTAPPLGWIAGGLVILVTGLGVHLLEPDMGAGHERLSRIVDVLVEMLQAGLLGIGFLVLCVAAIADRPSEDGRPEPADLLRRAGRAAWRLYSDG